MQNNEEVKNYCTLYIVRHGETDWNVKHIVQGHYNDTPLNTTGEKQAKALSSELKHVHFDKVFSSDLQRASKTAEIIVLEKKLAVETTRLLRERQFGRFEGQPGENLKIIDELYDVLKEEEQKFSYKPFPDIESDEELMQRFITFTREVCAAYIGKTVLIVTHGAVMRTFLVHLGFLTYKEPPRGVIANTAYIKLLSDGVDFFIKETKGIKKPVDNT